MPVNEQQPPRGLLGGVREFFGLKRSMVGLLGMVILVGMGEHMGEKFLPLYMVTLGSAILGVGFLSGLDNLLGALYSFPGGYLADRLGTKRALVIFNLMAMAGYAIVIIIPSWVAVIVGAFFFLSWSAISLPATMGLVAKALPKDKRTMGVGMHSLIRRIPKALGPLLGGIFIDIWGVRTGVRLSFAVALIMALIALIIQQALIADDRPRNGAPHKAAEKSPLRLWRRMSGPLRNLLVSDILIRFCEQIPDALVVLWAMQTIAHPVSGTQFGVLTTIEMATAMVVYIPVAYLADRTAKKPFVLATFCFFTLFPLVLYFSRSFEILILAFVLRGLKEFGEPTRKALIMDLAPEDAKAGMFGLYYLIRNVIVTFAAIGGAVIWQYASPQANLFCAFGFGVLGTVWFAVRGRDLTMGATSVRA